MANTLISSVRCIPFFGNLLKLNRYGLSAISTQSTIFIITQKTGKLIYFISFRNK